MNTPRPKWFISRGADIYTALIPADELPTNVNIQGVSRNMTVDQVVGMTLVAETGKSTQRYSLDKTPYLPGLGVDSVMSSPVLSPSRNFFAPTTPQSKQFLAPDTNVAVGAPTKIFPSDGARNVPKTVEQPSVSHSYRHVLLIEKLTQCSKLPLYPPPELRASLSPSSMATVQMGTTHLDAPRHPLAESLTRLARSTAPTGYILARATTPSKAASTSMKCQETHKP